MIWHSSSVEYLLLKCFDDILPSTIPTRPAYLERKTSRISIDIEHLSSEVEIFVDFGFHSFPIKLIGQDPSCGHELISWATLEKGERYTNSEKFSDFFSIFFRYRARERLSNVWKILENENFCESSWEFFSNDTRDEFLRMQRELFLQEGFPFQSIYIR